MDSPGLACGFLLVVLAGLCGSALADRPAPEWHADLQPQKPGLFAGFPNLEATYFFGWSGIKAAEARVAYTTTDRRRARMEADIRTTGAARLLWPLDVEGLATIHLATLQPVEITQTEKSRKKIKIQTIRFFPDGAEVSTRGTNGQTEWERAPVRVEVPRPFDLPTAMLFFRSQPLVPGDTYSVVALPGKTPYLATLSVLKHEARATRFGLFDTIRCDLRIQRINRNNQLEPHRHVRRLTVWISDDEMRLPVRIEADVLVGNVFCEAVALRVMD